MNGNSTLSVRGSEHCCLQEDHFAMAIYQDNRSESDQCTPCPAFPRPKLRIDSQVTVLLEHEKEEHPESFAQQEQDLFQDSLFVSSAKSRPRNPWAAVGSVTLLSLFLVALVVIPLLHTDTLPKWETVTMLYLPPAAAASTVTSLPAPTFTSGSAPTKIRIPSVVHAAQKATSPQLDTAGGLVGEFLENSQVEVSTNFDEITTRLSCFDEPRNSGVEIGNSASPAA